MKNIFNLILLLALALGPTLKADAKVELHRLSDSPSVIIVLDMIYSASFDFDELYLVESDNQKKFDAQAKCSLVKAKEVYSRFNEIFDLYLSYYPDDDLPFDQAREDLKHILGDDAYLKCSNPSVGDWNEIEIDFYKNLNRDYWIKFEVQKNV